MKHTRNTQYTPKSSPELRTPKQPPDPLQGGINNLTFLATQQTRQKSTRRPPTHQIRHQHTNSTSGGAETRAPPSPNSKNDRTKHNHERSTKTRERKKHKIEEERKKGKNELDQRRSYDAEHVVRRVYLLLVTPPPPPGLHRGKWFGLNVNSKIFIC
jgi:hypothetical protein